MGSRLRQLVKKEAQFKGKGKLMGKMIDKLTIYYGLAIRRNKNSVKDMYNEIWATYNHYSSTDKIQNITYVLKEPNLGASGKARRQKRN